MCIIAIDHPLSFEDRRGRDLYDKQNRAHVSARVRLTCFQVSPASSMRKRKRVQQKCAYICVCMYIYIFFSMWDFWDGRRELPVTVRRWTKDFIAR